MDFLTKNGKMIYERLREHCRTRLNLEDIDDLELSMLANSFDMYNEAAKECNANGFSMTFATEKGEYSQIKPEYTVMKNEYQNILKHGAKFGLNPGDRKKIFNITGKEKKRKGFDLGGK